MVVRIEESCNMKLRSFLSLAINSMQETILAWRYPAIKKPQSSAISLLNITSR